MEDHKSSEKPGVENRKSSEKPAMKNHKSSEKPALENQKSSEKPVMENRKSSEKPAMENRKSSEQPAMDNRKSLSKEDRALEQLKSLVDDLIRPDHDDYYLSKWLKARNYDPNKAAQMFRASMTYREKMGVDTILTDYKLPEVLEKYMVGGHCGFDRDGSPVRIVPYGRLDMKGIMYSAKKSDLEKEKMRECELTVRLWQTQSAKLCRRIDGQTVIFDMDGVGTKMLWKPGLQMYLHLVKVLEDNYPEMMKRLLVINAPRIFPLLYKICRPLISEDMKKKIYVNGGDYRRTLLKYISESELPVCYGGTLTDVNGDAKCSAQVCYGGPVPDMYYLKDHDLHLTMDTLIVPKSDKVCVEYSIEHPGTILRWEFRTTDYDIGFGVFYTSRDGHMVEVEPMQRVNSHVITQDGSHTCQHAGTYKIYFDNTFSWTRNKKIYYSVERYPPDHVTGDVMTEIDRLTGEQNWEELSERFHTTHL